MNRIRKMIVEKFVCDRCSACCCREGGVVYVSALEVGGIACYLGLSVLEFKQKYIIETRGWMMLSSGSYGDRCFLDENNRCQIYDVRPKKCRSYPDWDEIWESEEVLQKEEVFCPGLRRAKFSIEKGGRDI
jgi:uncharacterized protein